MKKLITNFIKENIGKILIYDIAVIIAYFMSTYSFGYIVSLVEGEQLPIKHIIYIILAIYLTILITKGISTILEQKLYNNAFVSRINESTKYIDKAFKQDYINFENSQFLTNINRALNFFGGDSVGYQKILKTSILLIPGIILTLVSSVVIIKISIIAFIFILINALLAYPVKKILNEFDIDTELENGNIDKELEYFNNLATDYSYAKEVRIFPLPKLILDRYNSVINKSLKIVAKRLNINTLLLFGITMFEVIVYIILFVIAVNSKGFTISDLILLVTMKGLFDSSSNNLIEYIADFESNKKLYYRYSLDEVHKSNIEEIKSHNLDIEFKNVSFSYGDNRVLDDVNIRFNTIEKIAIMGENGAGKTTFIKLLIGLYEPESGEITINGRPSSKEERQQIFSSVFQNSHLFNGTLEDNYGNDIDENNEVFDTFINDFNLPIDKDTKFGISFYKDAFVPSGGNEKLLVILRALIQKSAMVVLDEPTSSLDPLNEIKVLKIINNILKDRGYVMISHRLGVSDLIEKIVIVNNHTIEAVGTHEELIEKSSFYKNIVKITKQLNTEKIDG